MKATKAKAAAVIGIIMVGLVTQAEALSFQSVSTMYYELQRELSAWQISIKQTAISMHQRSDTLKKTRQISSTGKDAINQTNMVTKVITDYSSTLGQPDSIKCNAVAEKDTMIKTAVDTKKVSDLMMKSYANSVSATAADNLNQRLEVHNTLFCSADEAKAGACKFKNTGLAGWDSNYGDFATQSTLSGDQVVGAMAYTENMSEPPPPEIVNCKSSACTQARAAYLSSAAHSSVVTRTLSSQVANRMNRQVKLAYTTQD